MPQVVPHDIGLAVGDVLERHRRAHVAERPHALGGGALVGVDDDPARVVDVDARRVQAHPVAIGHPADGDQQGVGRHARVVVERDPQRALLPGHPRGRPAEAQVVALGRERGELLGDRHVLAVEQRARHLDHDDVRSRRREDVGELRGDVAAAEHREPLRCTVPAHDRVRRLVRQARIGDRGRDERPAACGDDDLVGGQRDGVGPVDPQRPQPGEPRVPGVDGDPRRVDAGRPSVAGDRVEPAEHPLADRHPLHAVELRAHAEPACVGDHVHDLARVGQHLGRDATDVEAGAAEAVLLLDDRDVEVGEASRRSTRLPEPVPTTIRSWCVMPQTGSHRSTTHDRDDQPRGSAADRLPSRLGAHSEAAPRSARWGPPASVSSMTSWWWAGPSWLARASTWSSAAARSWWARTTGRQ